MSEQRKMLDESFEKSVNSPNRTIEPTELEAYRSVYHRMVEAIEAAEVQFDECFVDISKNREWVSIKISKNGVTLDITQPIEIGPDDPTFFSVWHNRILLISNKGQIAELLNNFTEAVKIASTEEERHETV